MVDVSKGWTPLNGSVRMANYLGWGGLSSFSADYERARLIHLGVLTIPSVCVYLTEVNSSDHEIDFWLLPESASLATWGLARASDCFLETSIRHGFFRFGLIP